MVGKEIDNQTLGLLNKSQKSFLKRLNRSATQAREIAKGKLIGNDLNKMLNEL